MQKWVQKPKGTGQSYSSHVKMFLFYAQDFVSLIASISTKNMVFIRSAITNGHTEGAPGRSMLNVSNRDYIELSLQMMRIITDLELDDLLGSIRFIVYLLLLAFSSLVTGREIVTCIGVNE